MAAYIQETSFIVIQGWMRTRLKLSGNDLICFALIYGFSQDGQGAFRGSLKYIQEAIGVATRQSVLNILARLEAKGLIVRETNVVEGVKFTYYKAYSEPQNEETQNLDTMSKNYTGVVQNLDGGSINFRHNNIIDNIDINIKEISPKGDTKKSKTLEEQIEFGRTCFRKELEQFRGKYSDDMLADFASYWCEPFQNPKGNNILRWHGENTWDLSRRLATWARIDAEKRGRQRGQYSKPKPLPTRIDFGGVELREEETNVPLEIDPNSDYAYMARKKQKMREALERSKQMAKDNNGDGLTILTR